MDQDPDVDKGFTSVDAQPDPGFLVAGMEATAQWPAVQELRRFERDHLRLGPGDALLDVGCGIADVARSLAPAVQPGGRVVGIDASEAMLAVARERAVADGVEATLRVGDAMALDEPDASFDACRTERMLQWLPDVDAAIAELVRVLRPGGRLSLIDTDWRTFAIDVPDHEAAEAVRSAVATFRGPSGAAGGRLLNTCRRLGLADLDLAVATHVWSSWDPDTEAAPSGFFPFDSVVTQLADAGHVDRDLAERFITSCYDEARAGRMCMSLTMFAVGATKP